MKVGIFQDIHANLPAFKKGIEFFRQQGCDKIYHVGDLIGIGPHPKEVFHLAITIKEMTFIMGNHDYWFGFGIPTPRPKYMNEEELEHQLWVHQQIGKDYRNIVQSWKFVEALKFDCGKRVSFLHYGYDAKRNWLKAYLKDPNTEALDIMFEEIESELIFYGHNHEASDFTGQARYVNLGSAGCYTKPEVRLGILEMKDSTLVLEKHSIPYEDNGLMEDFNTRKVPAREFITKHFIKRD